ncbi:MAG TPA: aldo/keto reductase, partial [Candidatus Aquilonibacter sp.]|nr:aldo/keto reductase [Candidatus Aquilonibacter sp.]
SEGTRFAYTGRIGSLYRDRYWQDKLFDAVDALNAFAKEVGIPLATLSVAWVLAQPWVTSPIVGASRAEQLDATIGALDVTLDPAVLAKLGEMTLQFR